MDQFSYTENDRRYINPQVSLAEQNAFINNLRNNQQDWTDETLSVTENLGTKIPSQLGGLTGGSGYFASRYQTPQTNSMISDLRAAAQSQALSQLMNNEIAKAKKRYQDAYRAAKKRESDANSNGGNGNDLADYLKELKTNLNPDESSDPLDTDVADPNSEGAAESTKSGEISRLEFAIRLKEKQIEDLKKNGRYAGYSDFEKFISKINPISDIANANVWAGNYQRYNRELEDLKKKLEAVRGY